MASHSNRSQCGTRVPNSHMPCPRTGQCQMSGLTVLAWEVQIQIRSRPSGLSLGRSARRPRWITFPGGLGRRR